MSGYNLVISVIRLTQSMPFHMLDSVLYLTNIKNEIEWVQADWTHSIIVVFGSRQGTLSDKY